MATSGGYSQGGSSEDGTDMKSYSFTSRGLGAGINYSAGNYFAPATDTTLTDASPIDTLGNANVTYAAHAFLVAEGPGTVSGGAGPVEIEVSGTSITDAGLRTPGDSEVLVADITTLVTDQFLETTKKWIGQIVYTIQNALGSTQTTFSFTFNYGFNKYEDFGNNDFILTDFECVGIGGAVDTDFNIRLLKQDANNWTYTAVGFIPGGTELLNMNTIHNAESNTANGHPIIFKMSELSIPINGNNSEGLIVEITTGANNTVQVMDIHIGVELN